MRKNISFAIITFLLLALFGGSIAQTTKSIIGSGNTVPTEIYTDNSMLIKAFEESQANPVEYNINNTLHIKGEFWDLEEMEYILENLFQELNIEGEVVEIGQEDYLNPYISDIYPEEIKNTIFINKLSEIGYNQITVTSIDKQGKITVLIVHSTEFDADKDANIIIDIVQNKGYKDIVKVSNQNEEILSKYGSDIETTMCLVGTFPGEMSIEENTQKIQDIITVLDAQKIEEVIEKSYISTTLFSPHIPQAIRYDGKTVNLQLAMRYNSYEDQTYLWIATPLITTTY